MAARSACGRPSADVRARITTLEAMEERRKKKTVVIYPMLEVEMV